MNFYQKYLCIYSCDVFSLVVKSANHFYCLYEYENEFYHLINKEMLFKNLLYANLLILLNTANIVFFSNFVLAYINPKQN